MLRALLLATLLLGTASAHVPSFAQAGSSPETAFVVQNPDQSRVFYGDLNAGDQHWFRFDREVGDAIDVSIHLPPGEASRPSLWLVGPGLAGTGPHQTPSDQGGQVASLVDELSVEPFTPLAMRLVASLGEQAPANGTFFVVVEAVEPVTYSVAIGRGESFTPAEWVAIPAQRVGIVAWAGIPWPVGLVGEVGAASAAGFLVWRRGLGAQAGLGIAAAATLAGTALTTFTLALIAAIQGGISGALAVPLVFAAIAAAVGFGSYRAVRAGKPWAGVAWATAALVAWAGLILAPVALLVWAAWQWGSNRRGPTPQTGPTD